MIPRLLCWLLGHQPYEIDVGGAHVWTMCHRCPGVIAHRTMDVERQRQAREDYGCEPDVRR